MTTTTFIGDIKFKDGDTDRLVSDLATVDEVNEAFTKYYDKTQCDNAFALKSTTYTKTECDDKFALKGESGSGSTIDAYTKTECDSKFASKQQQYSFIEHGQDYDFYFVNNTGWCIDCPNNANVIIECSNTIAYQGRLSTGTNITIWLDEFPVSMWVGDVLVIGMAIQNVIITSVYAYQEKTAMANVVYKNEVYTKTECDDKFALKNPSTTITHYAPIEEPIANYIIGNPTFMSGKVYKLDEKNNWILSTQNDSTDCICSCITTGNSKTFAGIITSIDSKNNSITFATHGDYLFKVSDSSKYNIGDTICYDGSIVDENITPTIAIQQSIIGKVSGIVDDNTLAIFKTV